MTMTLTPEELFNANINLVYAYINRHSEINILSYEREDLIQEGLLILFECCKRYDAARGKLSTLVYKALDNQFKYLHRADTHRLNVDDSIDAMLERGDFV
jgi:DNA-directed RNA polymerase specialized sigma subunit